MEFRMMARMVVMVSERMVVLRVVLGKDGEDGGECGGEAGVRMVMSVVVVRLVVCLMMVWISR